MSERVYYHLLIELNDSKKTRCCKNDLRDRQEIIRDYLIPYLQKSEFQIDDRKMSMRDIAKIYVRQTNCLLFELYQGIKAMLKPKFQSQVKEDELIWDFDNSKNVTNDFLIEAEETIKRRKMIKKQSEKMQPKTYTEVFIVHGHDNAAKQETARFIENLGFTAIILSEQPNEGMTIIEKLERYTNVGFGIVLYTPCDEGRKQGAETLKPRARQNVVFEHGLLIGKIGRNHVHALKVGDLETPNDISGVVYTPMDEQGGWKTKIAKEMQQCGYKIDWTKLATA